MTLPSLQARDADAAQALRVLVIEDNAADAMVAEAAVARAARGPFEALRAQTLAGALSLIASQDVHLVLLDLNLPDCRGIDTLRRLRAVTRSPIIVVTGADTPGLDESALAAGAFEILHKGQLSVEAIARLLRLAEGQRRVQDRLDSAQAAAREELRRSEARYQRLTELASDWYWEQDAELRFTHLSPGFAERTGADPGRVLGQRRWEIEDTVPAAGTWEDHRRVLEARLPFRDFVQVILLADGARQFVSSSGIPVYDEAGAFSGYRGVGWNITARRDAEKTMERLARFDSATGLPNRSLLRERLAHALAQAERRQRGVGVLLVDLDGFKLVNDTLGHQAGDALLAQVGLGLRDCVRRGDTVGRVGGDEFAVVLADLAHPEDAGVAARKILESFGAPFDLDGRETFITPSIGVAAYPQDGEDAETLLQRAEAAMGRVKESTRNAYCFYATEMNERSAAKLRLNGDLRRAMERGEFELYYQPKVHLADGALVGMEGLLRWRHPERGMVLPNDFVPALEESGMINAVGDWVIAEACRQLRDWARAGLAPVPLAINLSARQFERRDLDTAIARVLAAHGVSAALLELEVTESCLMADPEDAVRQLQRLKAEGLRIVVDDFGTGYSSLAYLTRLPLSALKIDAGFVNAATSEPQSAVIVKMIIDMAQRLNFGVVGEGIETREHAAFLLENGCRQGQGRLYGEPAPAVKAAGWLRAA